MFISIVKALTTGKVTHDYPVTVEEATELDLPITVGLPPAIYNLMELYPQPQGNTSRCLMISVRLYQSLREDLYRSQLSFKSRDA